MNYHDWNLKIARHFFNEDMAGNRVYLNVTEGLIDELGASTSAGVADFIETLKQGPPELGRAGLICDKALKILNSWHHADSDYPPYIAYLALFVLATNKGGDYSVHAYHPRLRQILDPTDNSKSTYPSFEETYKLWSDLEQWANKDMQGRYGMFYADIVGSHFHIGLPRAQALLTNTELNKLPEFFIETGLSSDNPPSDEELLSLLSKHGESVLRTQVLHLLDNDTQARELIAKIVSDKLWDWDGTVAGTHEHKVFGTLILSLKYDDFAGVAQSNVYAKCRFTLPEEYLTLQNTDGSSFLVNGEASLSSPLRELETELAIDASTLSWDKDLRLVDSTGRLSFAWTGSPVRIFINGSTFGMADMIETKQLPSTMPFWLAIRSKSVKDIEEWGKNYCTGFKKLDLTTGFPTGWQLYSAQCVTADSGIKDKYPILALPNNARFNLTGGIPIRGNRYFAFAPPMVAVLAYDPDSFEMLCDGQPLPGYCKEGFTCFEIHSEVGIDKYIQLQLKFKGQLIQTRYIFLDSKVTLPDYNLVESNCVDNTLLNETPPCPFVLFGLNPIPKRLILLGDKAGQICKYSKFGYPSEWEPKWLVLNGRRIIVKPSSLHEHFTTSNGWKGKKYYRMWHELVWHKRKRTVIKTIDCNLKRRWQELTRTARVK